ncbi:beta-galactosidase [Brytella acorum]|uniref:Beta-galactosidase n=1 Tax=Brytella acorum TaxID=2959299 RepID=A0AA35UHP3_9PROT|nr:beta-galactosidase [Brytella acorum]MDF3625368.1 beta-galactosidase [Brytella acorum]CAI9121568.1 beta-galactosidase [Brytella acorum]
MTFLLTRRLLLSTSLSTLAMSGLATSGLARANAADRHSEPVPDGSPHLFTLHPEGFRLDGRPFQIRAGEMHPIRIPRSAWRQRIEMARAMGLNCISIYVMWNSLESRPGVFDLTTDRRDFAAFIRLCAECGMWVYFRPGPYVCAEWDLGGLPSYLLEGGPIALRTRDPAFLAASERYIATIAPILRPLLAKAGGSVLMTQIENEYASFGKDDAYMQWVHETWQRYGIEGPFSIADGLSQLLETHTTLPGVAIGLDGEKSISGAKGLASSAPIWISEAYPGWLTHWRDKTFARADFGKDLQAILAAGLSFSLYVVHGGTNFGFGAGANARKDGLQFEPVITSYDYGAPIDETGAPTSTYRQFRTMIAEATGLPVPAVPPSPPMATFPPVLCQKAGSLWDFFTNPLFIGNPVSIERALRQGQGMALYRTVVPAGASGKLNLPPIHDYARLFLDGEDIGTLSRMSASETVTIAAAPQARRLDVLVDTFGHIGYGAALGDLKGLEGIATLGAHILDDWSLFGLPLDFRDVTQLMALPESAGGFLFKARFDFPAAASTYLDMSAWRKGYVWINGHLLGRFWDAGPQKRLYCPQEWLKKQSNEVFILDYHLSAPAEISGKLTLAQ